MGDGEIGKNGENYSMDSAILSEGKVKGAVTCNTN